MRYRGCRSFLGVDFSENIRVFVIFIRVRRFEKRKRIRNFGIANLFVGRWNKEAVIFGVVFEFKRLY